ncbi:hypothetical protein ACFLZT_06515 [Thermodesulfobacteriota bacterium]
MGNTNNITASILGFVLMLAILSSCATIPELNVTYRIPPKTDALNNIEIILKFKDNRNDKNIIGDGARKTFESFPGNIYLSIARDQDKGFMIGLFDVESIFIKAFEKRLSNMGLIVGMEKRKGRDELVIVLNEFMLDLVGQSWKAKIIYEAQLVRDGEIIRKQIIAGDAERLKIIGRSQADVIMGDTFTDVVNQLDIIKLLTKVGGYGL